ncbi:MAG TPA: hypothetical protein PLK34_00440 [Candidatus Pacearchaeota archaeon]|nr:hypothetical protein [Candidatus Pacearchaeota archaeon]
MNNLKNKKGQVGEGMTWFVATLVIVVFLVISLAITKVITTGKIKTLIYDPATDLIVQKSFTGLLLSQGKNSETIFDELKKEELSGKGIKELNEVRVAKLLSATSKSIFSNQDLKPELEIVTYLSDVAERDALSQDSICSRTITESNYRQGQGIERILINGKQTIQVVFSSRENAK